jgi:ERCC4-type nuclease
MSPANLVKKNVLVSPADIGQIGGKVSRSKRRQLISSSDEEQDSDSSEIMCSLKTRIADKQKSVESHCGRDLKQIHDNSSKSKVELTISKEREERISRQKEKQEEFKRNMINKQQNEKLDEKNSIVGNKSTSPSNVKIFSETSQFTDDTDLLLYTRHTDSKPVVIVDSREINGAQDIISALRFQHNLNVIVAQLDSCDYVVSMRMGIDRKQWSEFSNGSNCAKMTACVQVMCDFYERPCLIIEKDKLRGDEKSGILHWTKYVDKTLVQLIHSKVTLFFTENQLETASIIADLCQLENRKNCAISCQVDLNTEQQSKVKFYKSIPHLSYVHSLFLCNNFITVTNFLRSDVKTIMTNGKMTEERAVHVYNYIRRTFDSQMLPSSYN